MNFKTKSNQQSISFYFRLSILLVGIFCFNSSTLLAQDNPEKETVEVKMKDGSKVIGDLIAETPEKLIIQTAAMGEVTILKSNMVEFRRLQSTKMVDGIYWHENPNPTRNIYGPTGYGLGKGEGYYQNFMLFINQISYGFTDNFTIGVGFEIVSILSGLNDDSDSNFPGFTITPKFSIPIKENKWNLGVGVLALHVPGNDELFSAGILYGVSTWGSRDNNFTLGLGFGIAEGEFTGRPTITLAGNTRVSKRFGLVTENWFVPLGDEYGSLISVGGRYIGERITWDFSLFGAGAFDSFFVSPIPLVGITIPFGTGWKG